MAQTFELNSVNFIRTLGKGAFGRVRLAIVKQTGEYVAVKCLKKSHLIRTKQVDHVSSEYQILKLTRHPLLVNLIGFTQDSSYLYFALEFVPGGDLFTFLRRLGKFENAQAKIYASQIALMFEYLHSFDIIYRDLKPENLLIGADGYLKLTDFGFAKFVTDRTYTLCGTPEYIAPEILLNKGHGKPVDWWTLGVIIYEMIAGIDPFTDEDPMMIYRKILKCKFSFTSNFDRGAKSLVKRLLVVDLSKRYGNLRKGVGDIKQHSWFKEINWIQMVLKQAKMPYVPALRDSGDCSHFMVYPESLTSNSFVSENMDPFIQWNN